MTRDATITSKIMSSIRSEGGKADKALGSALWRIGLRYRRSSQLLGKPDFVFKSARLVVFVDGDFWHGRHLEERVRKGDFKSNAEYWIPKLKRNRERDREVSARLAEDGWTVLRFWESDVKRNMPRVIEQIEQAIRGSKTKVEENGGQRDGVEQDSGNRSVG